MTQARLAGMGISRLLIGALFAVTSCARSFDMSGERISPPGPEWGVVIGSVLVQPDPIVPGTTSPGRDTAGAAYDFDIVQIQPADPNGETPYAQQYRLDAKAGEERMFVARLRPGQYLIRRFHQAAVAGVGGELDLVFDAAPGAIRYIGRVRVEIPRRVSSGKDYRFTVENAREATLARMSLQHGELTEAVVDGPMHARLPVAP